MHLVKDYLKLNHSSSLFREKIGFSVNNVSQDDFALILLVQL